MNESESNPNLYKNNKKMYTETVKIEDIDIELESNEDELENKRKMLKGFKTFKNQQEKQLNEMQINILHESMINEKKS